MTAPAHAPEPARLDAALRAYKHRNRVAVVFPAGNTYDPDKPGTPLEQHDRAVGRILAWAENRRPAGARPGPAAGAEGGGT